MRFITEVAEDLADAADEVSGFSVDVEVELTGKDEYTGIGSFKVHRDGETYTVSVRRSQG